MAVFMPGRLRALGALLVVQWLLKAIYPTISTLLVVGAVAYGGWYVFLLVRTLQAVVLGPLFWGLLGQLVVVRCLTRDEFFGADSAPEDIVKRRQAAFDRLSASWKERWAKVAELQKYLKRHWSDLRFKASGFESMFPIFQDVVTEALDPITIVESTEGCDITDTSGSKFLDASGAYGVNFFGYTKSKEFLKEGQKLADKVGPCLGPVHPVVRENIEMLLKIFRKEEVSFHMSGTEAVMSAVYQARFHTQRSTIAVFQGAYHGWWDGVMQGAGNDRFVGDCLILKDQCESSLELLKLRSHDIAALLVNPIQGFGWKTAVTNKLATAKVNAGTASMDKFKLWLHKVRQTCTAAGIPLIFDETWSFHLGAGGSQELYGVEPDLLVLGKSLGGGHSCGAVLGPSRLMERRDLDRCMRVNFVVGTFKGNPVAMGSMNAALKFVTSPEAPKIFNDFRDRVARWMGECNATLENKDLPIRVTAHRTTLCISYSQPSLYNFLFMYYLREAGLIMAWVGTGKMLLNLEFSEADLRRMTDILVKAAVAFKADGWWYEHAQPFTTAKLLPLVLGPTLSYHLSQLKRRLGLDAGSCAPPMANGSHK